jgi:hypothetical protein
VPGRDRTLPVSGRAFGAREVIPTVSELTEASEPSESVDEKVLRLRSEGQPYARISRDLGLDRGLDAQRAFLRALERLPASDAERVRGEEMHRLDRLAARVRSDEEQNDMDRARRLKTIDRMRTQIGAHTAR